jgi:hypothetical protein
LNLEFDRERLAGPSTDGSTVPSPHDTSATPLRTAASGRARASEGTAVTLLFHEVAPDRHEPTAQPFTLTWRRGETLLIGRAPTVERLPAALADTVAGTELRTLRLDLRAPTSCVSRLQLVGLFAGDRPSVTVPDTAARDSEVFPQPWGASEQAVAVPRSPMLHELPSLTTLWLPASDYENRHRGRRWAISVVNPCAPVGGPVPQLGATGLEVGDRQLFDTQHEAVLVRFGDFLHFPPRSRHPQPASVDRDIENRLGRLRETLGNATELPPATSERFLGVLLRAGAVRLDDVADLAHHYGIALDPAVAVLRGLDARPGPRPSRHPAARLRRSDAMPSSSKQVRT